MFTDDIFEGWLSVPSMESLFEEKHQMSSSSSPSLDSSTMSEKCASAAINPMRVVSDIRNNDQLQLSVASDNDSPANLGPRRRKGHTKSRLGCITCKRRKIKCQEQWPSCANCKKRGTPCRYPTVFNQSQHERIVSEVMKTPRQFIRLNDTPTTYSANDMRLFHHFLIAAHPSIPYEYEAVWIREVPAFSHQYEYLMHAILALSGSHLSLCTEDSQDKVALSHRQRAITGLEDAFTRWPPNAEEAHVMLATSYLLAFQSTYFPDGFLDHILSLRGCALISQSILSNQLPGTFSVDPNLHNMSLEIKLRNFPELDQALGGEALQSLVALGPLLNAPSAWSIERAMIAELIDTLRPLLYSHPRENPTSSLIDSLVPGDESSTFDGGHLPVNPHPAILPLNHLKNPLFPGDPAAWHKVILAQRLEGISDLSLDHKPDPVRSFNALMSSLLILATWPQNEVLHLFSPTNNLGNVVMAHFCAVRFIVAPLSAPESVMRTPIQAMVEWCEKMIDAVEDDEEANWTQYLEWPTKVLRTMQSCVHQKRGLTFGDVFAILMEDPGAFREGRSRRI